jgi:UDP-N-acetylglucosamine--N-acetylmuramyl-(pentapeptide) pyrophosphoryl-undecaprenol N-acetylglucosamine transferase
VSSHRPIYLAASGGGHLDLLRSIAPALADYERTWITTPGRGAERLAADGERVLVVPPVDLRNRGLGNPRRSLRIVAAERPRTVITSGAGIAVTFTAAARALGARVLFAETMARVADGSVSGRILTRLAHTTLVQWPEMASVHRGAIVCRPALLDGLAPAAPRPGQGTFVTLGTHHQGFTRLLEMVEAAAAAGILPRPVRGQTGASGHFASELPDSDLRPWWKPDEMREGLHGAEVVVTHAGAGVIASCLRAGRRPLVLARLGSRDEHVDDHQRQLARKLSELGLVVELGDRIGPEDVRAARTAPVVDLGWPAEMPTVQAAVHAFLHASG